jgi:hypothetical protein
MTDRECAARSAISATLAACAQAGDARKVDAYVRCFTESGELELTNAHSKGREAIRAWMTAPSPFAQPGGVSPGYVNHHLTTCRIDLTSDSTAKVRTYWLVITAIGLDHSGYYDDSFVKVGGDWLIAHRRPRTLWFSPDSIVAGGHE